MHDSLTTKSFRFISLAFKRENIRKPGDQTCVVVITSTLPSHYTNERFAGKTIIFKPHIRECYPILTQFIHDLSIFSAFYHHSVQIKVLYCIFIVDIVLYYK